LAKTGIKPVVTFHAVTEQEHVPFRLQGCEIYRPDFVATWRKATEPSWVAFLVVRLEYV